MWRVLILAAAACATAQAPSESPAKRGYEAGSCKAQPPVGNPSQFTLRTRPGFTIAEPMTCQRGSYIRIERASGSFSRSLTLPEGVDPDSVRANFDKGVLEVSIPKPEERKPRRVAIGVSGKSPVIEGSSQESSKQGS